MHLITMVEKEIRDKELPTKVKVNSDSLLTRSSSNKKETSLVEDRGYLVRKAFMLYYYSDYFRPEHCREFCQGSHNKT